MPREIDYSRLEAYFHTGPARSIDFSPFKIYLDELLLWNEKINLTAIREPMEIIERHFIDSLALLGSVSRGTVLDIGSGAGFPGLPLKLAIPEIELTLAESIKKKADFLKAVIRRLGLKGASVINERVGPDRSVGRFDYVITRASFGLPEFIEIALRQLNQTGQIVAMRGPGLENDILEINHGVNMGRRNRAGLVPLEVKTLTYTLPYSKAARGLVLIKQRH